MATFPSISAKPSAQLVRGYSDAADAADIRTPAEAGYKITRKRFTRVPLVYDVQYVAMTNADHNILAPFIDLYGTTGNFDWTHPIFLTTHDVRFVERPQLIRKGIFWYMSCRVEEV